jgi:hypothetical protein
MDTGGTFGRCVQDATIILEIIAHGQPGTESQSELRVGDDFVEAVGAGTFKGMAGQQAGGPT